MRETATGLVLTYNGERILDKCLQSLDFCDEIIVVDSGSTDSTVEIAEKHGARVLVNPWPGPVKQYAFVLPQIKNDWLVCIDQDEYLSDELRDNIIDKLSANEPVSGYYVPRSSFYFDRFMKHSGWYPDYLYRVFRNGQVKITASGPHQHFAPTGKSEKLTGDIMHYTYESFMEHITKINYYAEVGAEDLRAKGRKGGLTRALLHGWMKFIKIYFLKAGLLDGKAGFYNAVAGFFYTFQKYIRVEETKKWGE
ncbi:MAG: glycosyl transferase family 2 [Desulfovibrio sp.]|nr:glycosyl transferase family 2 [Desulfovibrio sp.]|tara:strand:- start:57286 stop:58041 length:756 start_codon:yes stop_codon:yes gene_type:complete